MALPIILSFANKAVAYTFQGDDLILAAGKVFTQPVDVHIQRAGIIDGVCAPYFLQQVVSANYGIPVAV